MSPTPRSRRDALLELLQTRRLDYIPATTYGVDRYSHPWMAADPSYRRVLEYTDAHDHIFALHLSYYGSFGFTDILGVPDPERLERRVIQTPDATRYEFVLHTPRGDLTSHATENVGVRTVWRHDPLIKSDDDIDRFLSFPFVPSPLNVLAFERTRAALDERGVIEIEVPDPLCLVIENMEYEDFMLWSLLLPDKIEALLEQAARLIDQWLEGLLRAGAGPVFRIFGAEYAAPPMMSPEFFKRAVANYDRALVDLIHRYGGYVRYHCHGPIAAILDHFLEIGADLTDPCEAPPSGDITLSQLARRVGRDLILMGNIQLDDIERASAETIGRLVAQAIEQVADRAPLILCLTAPPFESPLPAVTERNLIQFLESAEKYGMPN